MYLPTKEIEKWISVWQIRQLGKKRLIVHKKVSKTADMVLEKNMNYGKLVDSVWNIPDCQQTTSSGSAKTFLSENGDDISAMDSFFTIKTRWNDSDRFDDGFILIKEKLFEHKCKTPTQHEKKLIFFDMKKN